jgi:hypothetical protein
MPTKAVLDAGREHLANTRSNNVPRSTKSGSRRKGIDQRARVRLTITSSAYSTEGLEQLDYQHVNVKFVLLRIAAHFD